MIRFCRVLVCLSLFLLLIGTAATAQRADAPTPITVATRVLPPFVIAADDQTRTLSGFSVELWGVLADRLHLATRWATFDSVGAVLNAVETGAADAAIAAITITAERETRVDFSAPIFNAGLDILTRADAGLTLADMLHGLLSSPVTQIVLVLALTIGSAGGIVWLGERRGSTAGSATSRHGMTGAIEGIGRGVLIVATAGAADQTPRGLLGRALALLAIFVGLALLAQLIAALINAALVGPLVQVNRPIASVDDLHGRSIGTVAGTTAETYLRERTIAPLTFPNFDAAAAALLDSRIDAIVYDAPVLADYVSRAGRGLVQTTGQIFDQEYYGIAVPIGSPLRERINAALLASYEDGTYQALYDRWFGG